MAPERTPRTTAATKSQVGWWRGWGVGVADTVTPWGRSGLDSGPARVHRPGRHNAGESVRMSRPSRTRRRERSLRCTDRRGGLRLSEAAETIVG